MKNKLDDITIYVWVFRISMLVIAVWIVLKAIGVIHSPTWIELIPYAGMIFAGSSGFQVIVDLKRDTTNIKMRQNRMADALVKLETKINYIEKDLDLLKA